MRQSPCDDRDPVSYAHGYIDCSPHAHCFKGVARDIVANQSVNPDTQTFIDQLNKITSRK